MTAMTAMRMSREEFGDEELPASRISIINPSSTMRFVDANMNARKFTA